MAKMSMWLIWIFNRFLLLVLKLYDTCGSAGQGLGELCYDMTSSIYFFVMIGLLVSNEIRKLANRVARGDYGIGRSEEVDAKKSMISRESPRDLPALGAENVQWREQSW